jgi:Chaperone of endosialidase
VGGTYPNTQNAFALSWNTMEVGKGVAEFVNYSATGGGDAFDFFLVPNTGAPSLSNRIVQISQLGDITCRTLTQTSDKRLKTGVQPLHYGLKEIMILEPKEYDFHMAESVKDGEVKLKADTEHQIGFLAQDVYQIVPEAVKKPADPQGLACRPFP